MDNESSVRKVCPAGTLQAGSNGLNSCPANFACYLNAGLKFTENVLQYPQFESAKFSSETKWYAGTMSNADQVRCFQSPEKLTANGDVDYCSKFEIPCGMDMEERFVSFGDALDIGGNPICKCSPQVEVGEKWGKNFREIGNFFATVIVVINMVWIARFFFLLVALTKKAYWEGIKKGICGKIFKCCCSTMEKEMSQGKQRRQANDFAQEMVNDWMEVQDDDGNAVLFNPFTGKIKPRTGLSAIAKEEEEDGNYSWSSNDSTGNDSGFAFDSGNDIDDSGSSDSDTSDMMKESAEQEGKTEALIYDNPLHDKMNSGLDMTTIKALVKLRNASAKKKGQLSGMREKSWKLNTLPSAPVLKKGATGFRKR
eukprot:g5183.t1